MVTLGSAGFRPAFRFYNKWVSLLGAVVSIGIMFVLSWYYALATFGCLLLIFVYILRRKPGTVLKVTPTS
jgi:4-hydroxybenzoate polyprenyltransferase